MNEVLNPGDMNLMSHLRELRKRLVISILAILIAAIACYSFVPEIFDLLCRPFRTAFAGNNLIGTGPAEALMLRIYVSFFAGVVIAIPVIFYQLWLFISPGLYENERQQFVPFVFITSLLFLVGMTFCYIVVLPTTMQFFKEEYTSLNLIPQIRMTEQLSLVFRILIGFGVIFEMPVLAFFLARLGVINHRMMISWGRHAIVLIFIVAAILTPPDVVDQLAMALPLLLLYGVSIGIVRYTAPRSDRKIV